MLDKFVLALVIVALLYLGAVLLKSYQPLWFEGFSEKKPPLAVAPPVFVPPSMPERVVAPAGPAAPAAAAPRAPMPLPSPPETPTDPYDEVQGKIPIEDNLRHPENSFGPGLQNRGTFLSEASGVASKERSGATASFSPEFAQNGGEFMNGIFANTTGDEYGLV